MIQKIQFRAMGCHMMAAIDNTSKKAWQKLEQVSAWFEAWEQTFSRFREESELSRLNRSGGVPTMVSQELWEVFHIALQAEEKTEGLFSPAIHAHLVTAGYHESFAQLPFDQTIPEEIKDTIPAKMIGIQWDASARTIALLPGLTLDFGGIVKGWAANHAIQRLKNYGSVLVDAGGDIAISGLQSNGQPWPIGVIDPFDPQTHFETLHLGNCGVATSGIDYRRWKQNGNWMHHLIDPRTGAPAITDVLSVTAIASTVIEAEIAAKVALILGRDEGLALLEANKTLGGILVLKNGERIYSQRMDRYLWR